MADITFNQAQHQFNKNNKINMDVQNATIESIGEITIDSRSKKHKLAIDISTPSTPKKRYIIHRNDKYAFDLVKNFEAKVFKVGDKIDFDFNEPTGNYFPTIWRIANQKRKEN